MPTYTYVCKSCAHAFEIHQSFTDEALTDCPKCQGELRKQFGNLGVSFKGSGFYKNDSAPSKPSSSDS
ncbi:MAG: FmdB family transcriptional regulator [Micrococcales bacterium]|jgi:putative FmdB family regulatory protein|nr:FmdB family transcriptional regulator [Micrococcales bacterium]MDG1818141.1 zinc ribbon domain-containing protein [Aquiluna sp.]MBT5398098.1 FmdB family transcriptional regulator [Micrococcales bacterium]MBT5431037.1 FmdB family transcriptional regulator [Micrococcales bacterium]MBT5848615.1 FmdB family transcriptional regulator [Micrococcales bacterium]